MCRAHWGITSRSLHIILHYDYALKLRRGANYFRLGSQSQSRLDFELGYKRKGFRRLGQHWLQANAIRVDVPGGRISPGEDKAAQRCWDQPGKNLTSEALTLRC